MKIFKFIVSSIFVVVCTAAVAADQPDKADGENIASSGIEIRLASIPVEDQQKALEFYTEKLGFVVKEDVPVGEYRWLSVVSANNPDGTQLLLEPNDNPAMKQFQQSIFEQGIPATAFFVEDIKAEYERLKANGVEFTMEPTEAGTVTIAIFNDTCGNLIQIVQEN